jgi:hypothetical protein
MGKPKETIGKSIISRCFNGENHRKIREHTILNGCFNAENNGKLSVHTLQTEVLISEIIGIYGNIFYK